MREKYIIEARDNAGRLKFDCEQPIVKDYTQEQIFDLYFKDSGDKADSVTQEKVYSYFKSKNWYIRIKTW